MIIRRIKFGAAVVIGLLVVAALAAAQDTPQRGPAKPVTVPVTIRLRGSKPVEMRIVDYLLREDGEMQSILSMRSPMDSPLTLALLMQDDLDPSASTEIRNLEKFIPNQPEDSRVMIGYIRSGTLDVRRKFTTDLNRAAQAVRAPLSVASAAPFNPYVEIIEGLKKFDSQPLGRRAMIVVSDGIDVSRGVDSSTATGSLDLQRAITEAQRRSVAVYSIFVPPAAPVSQTIDLNGESCLEHLSNETGGRAFFQGISTPVSFEPFLNQIASLMSKQIALTYLSTHTKKGFHKLDIKPLDRDVEIRHPAGYTR